MTDKKHFLRQPMNETLMYKYRGNPGKALSGHEADHHDSEMQKIANNHAHDDAFHEKHDTRSNDTVRVGHKPEAFHKVFHDFGYKSEDKGTHTAFKKEGHPTSSSLDSKHAYGNTKEHVAYVGNHRVTSPGELHRKLSAIHGPLKEDVQIDEVSRKYLGKYIKAASADLNDHSFDAGRGFEKQDHKVSLPADKKAQKRLTGIHKATDKLTKEDVELDEGLKLIDTHTSKSGKKVAKVYKDSEWGEHRVKHFTDGKHHVNADYHTDDKTDANDTAKHWIKEDVELDEGKTYRNSENVKSNTVTKALKKYSAGKKAMASGKRRINEEKLDEFLGFGASKRMKDHEKVEPTFGAPKPKASTVSKKISSKRMGEHEKIEPHLDTPAAPRVAKHPTVKKASPVRVRSSKAIAASKTAVDVATAALAKPRIRVKAISQDSKKN